MGSYNYSKVGNITLEESGLLSGSSGELRKIIAVLKVTKVVDFLKLIDNNEFRGYKYRETLMEAMGLAKLLKQEYLNIPIDTNISFAASIKYMYFEDLSVWLYGIKTSNNKKINIYSLITLLGFNDDERNKILDVEESSLEDTLLIDLLYNAYVRINKYRLMSKDNQVMSKKLLIILKHYLIHYKGDLISNFMKDFYSGMEQFNDLLLQNNVTNKRK